LREKQKLLALFKANSDNFKNLTFEEFRRVLDQIGLEFRKDEGQQFRSDVERVQAFYMSLGLENRGYKHRLKQNEGAFLSKEKPNFRIPENDIGSHYKFKPHSGLSHEDKKSTILKRIQEKEMSRHSSGTGLQNLRKSNNSVLNERESKYHTVDRSSYFNIEKSKHLSEDKSKITWKKLENLTYTDLKGIGDEKFKPQDLIVEDDDEDALYMKEYNLQEEKAKRQISDTIQRKKMEEYGKISPEKSYVNQKTKISEPEKKEMLDGYLASSKKYFQFQ
jgi:hypothetical protein